MSVEQACARFFNEVGTYHAGADTTLTDLERLCNYLGSQTQISLICEADIARLIARRRGDGVANGTVNRSTTKLIRHLLSHAREAWGVNTKHIKWGRFLLKEPQEIVRELPYY